MLVSFVLFFLIIFSFFLSDYFGFSSSYWFVFYFYIYFISFVFLDHFFFLSLFLFIYFPLLIFFSLRLAYYIFHSNLLFFFFFPFSWTLHDLHSFLSNPNCSLRGLIKILEISSDTLMLFTLRPLLSKQTYCPGDN